MRKHVAELTPYQNAAYARQYQDFMQRVQETEARAGGREEFSKAVARSLFKLMAYKDEYEVARLYSDGSFVAALKETFEGDFTLKYNLAPPLFAKRDEHGHLIKSSYGPWITTAFGFLAKLKFLRGTALDLFGRSDERRTERQLINDYRAAIESLLPVLTGDRIAGAVKFASLPEQIRGFGHVKEESVQKVRAQWPSLLATATEAAAAKETSRQAA
jgi:indolepyruvate ferredoxin oxidoreductase